MMGGERSCCSPMLLPSPFAEWHRNMLSCDLEGRHGRRRLVFVLTDDEKTHQQRGGDTVASCTSRTTTPLRRRHQPLLLFEERNRLTQLGCRSRLNTASTWWYQQALLLVMLCFCVLRRTDRALMENFLNSEVTQSKERDRRV